MAGIIARFGLARAPHTDPFSRSQRSIEGANRPNARVFSGKGRLVHPLDFADILLCPPENAYANTVPGTPRKAAGCVGPTA